MGAVSRALQAPGAARGHAGIRTSKRTKAAGAIPDGFAMLTKESISHPPVTIREWIWGIFPNLILASCARCWFRIGQFPED
jgi:hypothetical protein